MSYRHELVLSSQKGSLYDISDYLIALSLDMVVDLQDLTRIGFFQGDLILYLKWLFRDLIDYIFYYNRTFSYTCARIGLSFYYFTLEFYQEFSVVEHSTDVLLSSLDRVLDEAILSRGISFYRLYYNAVALLLLSKYFEDLRDVVSLSCFQSFPNFQLTLLLLFTQCR